MPVTLPFRVGNGSWAMNMLAGGWPAMNSYMDAKASLLNAVSR